MKESIQKRIDKIKVSEDVEDLRKCVCPFFEKGGNPACVACTKDEDDVRDCKDYYLERITTTPMDLWSEDFDKFLVKERDTVSVEEVVGIGINCDNCYMYDKCPMYKKGYTCGIKWDTNKPATPMEFMDFLINTQYERVKRSSVFEKIDGGVPDVGLSSEMDRLHNLVASKIDMGRDRVSINVEATGAAREGGGILAKLFGGGQKEEKALPEKSESIVEVADFEEIKEPIKIKKNEQK